MGLQVHPGVVMKPAAVAEWQCSGTSIVITTPGRPPRAWPAADWRELADLWSRGLAPEDIQKLYEFRGYTEAEVEDMRALLAGNPFLLPPLERALFILAGLACRDDRAPGGFRFGDRPVRSVDVVIAANRLLATLALPQIRYPNVATSGGRC